MKVGEDAKAKGTQKVGGRETRKKEAPTLPSFLPFCTFSIQQTRLYRSLEQAKVQLGIRVESTPFGQIKKCHEVAAHQSAWLRGTISHRLKYPAVWKRSWKVKEPSLQLQNTCILASISFPKQSERECFDFETLFRNLEPPWSWDSRHSLTH